MASADAGNASLLLTVQIHPLPVLLNLNLGNGMYLPYRRPLGPDHAHMLAYALEFVMIDVPQPTSVESLCSFLCSGVSLGVMLGASLYWL